MGQGGVARGVASRTHAVAASRHIMPLPLRCMAGMVSGVVLVVTFGLVAVFGLALVAALLRISGRPESGGPDGDASER